MAALTNRLNRLPESSIAPYLTALQKRVQPEGIRIGSYPVIQKVPSSPSLPPSILMYFYVEGVYVSLIGSDNARVEAIAAEVQKETGGRVVSEDEMVEKRRKAMSGNFGG